MIESARIKSLVIEAGADLCGIARPMDLDADRKFLSEWAAKGYSSSLDYLKEHQDLRADIRVMVPGAESVIVCAFSYKNEYSDGYRTDCCQKIASYALSEDYHNVIRKVLSKVLSVLTKKYGAHGRVFTDSAPIFEKTYAVQAGLGWIGRQSLLVTPQFGTFVLLGEIVIDAECDRYDTPYSGKGCGSCRRCIDACPNRAILERHIDTRLCISRATVERESECQIPLHGWIFGCDECQNACPFSKAAPKGSSHIFRPLFNPEQICWESLSDTEFKNSLSLTPLRRSSLTRLRTASNKNNIQ